MHGENLKLPVIIVRFFLGNLNFL